MLLQYAEYDDLDEWIYEITTDIFEADQTKKLPKAIADFLISLYNYLIEQGCFDAACDIGSLYYKGRLGKVDYKKAVEYYTLAADNGNRQAQENRTASGFQALRLLRHSDQSSHPLFFG